MSGNSKFGTIKSLTDRGFGFITEDGASPRDKDIFFHARGIAPGQPSFEQLKIGQRVEFELDKDRDDRIRGINVKVLG